jgi:hypothetical protein
LYNYIKLQIAARYDFILTLGRRAYYDIQVS